jgi:hypothetical protein
VTRYLQLLASTATRACATSPCRTTEPARASCTSATSAKCPSGSPPTAFCSPSRRRAARQQTNRDAARLVGRRQHHRRRLDQRAALAHRGRAAELHPAALRPVLLPPPGDRPAPGGPAHPADARERRTDLCPGFRGCQHHGRRPPAHGPRHRGWAQVSAASMAAPAKPTSTRTTAPTRRLRQRSTHARHLQHHPRRHAQSRTRLYQNLAATPSTPNTTTAAFDDYFAYNLTEPITIRKNESALVPILQTKIDAERVTLWSAPQQPTPLRALWITNTSNLTLDRGSFSIVEDGNFGGEGLLDPIHPAEKRLLSYAVDQAVRVTTESQHDTTRPPPSPPPRASRPAPHADRRDHLRRPQRRHRQPHRHHRAPHPPELRPR